MPKEKTQKKASKKVDPEKQKEQFEQWKADAEGKLWDIILDIINNNKDNENKDAETLEDDFTLNYRTFLYKLQQLCEVYKVPKRPKSKDLIHK